MQGPTLSRRPCYLSTTLLNQLRIGKACSDDYDMFSQNCKNLANVKLVLEPGNDFQHEY